MTAAYGIYGDGSLTDLQQMGERLAHRGPQQVAWSTGSRVHLGVRVRHHEAHPSDLPIAFAGFLDNRPELLELAGADPHGAAAVTDPELVLALYHRYGLDGLTQIRGQFATALWDAARQRLLLICDPLAIRLLYVARAGTRYVFATEYKALLALDDLPAEPDRDAVRHLQCTKQPVPRGSLLRGVRPLRPGTCLELGGPEPIMRCYRRLAMRVTPAPEPVHAATLQQRLIESARRETRGHVVLGLALSSGLDSAVTLGAVRHAAPQLHLHTFTAGSQPADPDLAAAAIVARHFGTTHHEVLFAPDELPDLLPRVVWYMEDPIGREEMVYWYLLAREAAKYVPKMLCGNLSDLLFGGMPRFKIVKAATVLPMLRGPLEEFYNWTQSGAPPASLAGRVLTWLYHRGAPVPPPAVRGAGSTFDLARFDWASSQPLTAHLLAGLQGRPNPNATCERIIGSAEIAYNSPFYDLDLVDYAFQIPDNLKIRGRQQKYIVRQAAQGLLPVEFLRRPKGLVRVTGIKRLSEVLEALADEYLSAGRVRERGLFNQEDVEHLRRRPAGGIYPEPQLYRLWTLLLTEMWAGLFLDHRGAAPAMVEPVLAGAA